MPCRDDYPDNYTKGDLESLEHRVRKELEPLLCEACTLLEEKGLLTSTTATPELVAWFNKHEGCEKERVRLEAALKLTERERRLLGINLQDLQNKVAISKFPKR